MSILYLSGNQIGDALQDQEDGLQKCCHGQCPAMSHRNQSPLVHLEPGVFKIQARQRVRDRFAVSPESFRQKDRN